MSVYAIIGLVVIAFLLFMAFRPRKRIGADPGAPGDYSGGQDGGAAAYGDGGGDSGGSD